MNKIYKLHRYIRYKIDQEPNKLMNKLRLIFIALLFPLAAFAQDPQFSQFYAAPLYLNPAFAGSTQYTRVGMNYRNQWPSLDASFTTTSLFADHYIEDYNSGVGFLFTYDREGLAGLRSMNVSLQYAYQLNITDKLSFRPGFQVGYVNRSVNFDKLTFGDQFNANGQIISPVTAEQFNTGLSKGFVDLGVGGLMYTEKAWFGVSVHHLTEPNQSVIGESSALPRKFSYHGGYKIMLKDGVMGQGLFSRKRERSVTPTFQYKNQGEFDQLDLGLYLTLEPIIIGTWYRGLPMKQVDGFANNEAIVMLFGFTKKGKEDVLNIGYSYDITISQLGASSGGAHEFTMSYTWSNRDPRKPPKSKMRIPCPDF